MLNQPSWFSETHYYAEKFKELQSIEDPRSYDEMVADIKGVGGAWAHYEAYGYKESYTSSGAETYFSLQDSNGKVVFDSKAYCESKLAQLLAAGDPRVSATSTWQDAAKLIVNAGMSLYDHFVKYGQTEGLSISDTFSAESFFKAKLKQLQTTGTMPPELNGNATWQQLAAWYAAREIDSYQNWADYGVVSEGITADDVKPGSDGPGPEPGEGKTIYLNPLGWHGNIADGSLGYYYADDAVGTDKGDKFVAYVYDDENSLNTGDYINGKGGVDILEADIAGESYNSALTPIIENLEILKFRVQEMGGQTGDNNVWARIDAERIAASAESRATPMGKTGAYTEFWSWNSRDDLLIEDVRIKSTNVIVGMQNTDPGDVDYEFYFDPQHLADEGGGLSGTLRVELMDMKGANDSDSTNPLKTNPYNVLKFTHTATDGTAREVVLTLTSFNDETDPDGNAFTYDDLLKAINDAIAEAGMAGVITAAKTVEFTASTESSSGVTWSGKGWYIDLYATDGTFSNASWQATGDIPGDSAYRSYVTTDMDSDCPLIVTNVALDNVGRVQWDDAHPECLPDNAIYGSNAGDLVIGSMATRGGIERFDVYVDRGSWLSSLSSTNNALRMIQVTAADWNEDGHQGFVDVNDVDGDGDRTETINGQLFIGDHATMMVDGQTQAGVVNTDQTYNTLNWQDKAQLLWAGYYYDSDGDIIDTAGIFDVKLFDATAYAGVVNIAAKITAEGYDKYLADVDGLRTVYDNYAPKGEFRYGFGSNNDTLNMNVHGGILADRDFELVIAMNDGNDYVNFATGFTTGNQAISQAGVWTDVWTKEYLPGLRNVTIDTGNGADTVWTWGQYGIIGNVTDEADTSRVRSYYDGVAGHVKVDAGTGNDAVYTAQQATVFDPQGRFVVANNAVWVVNANMTASEDPLGVYYDEVGQAQPINNNIASTANYIVTAANGNHTVTVDVTFLGVTATATVGTYTASSGSYSLSADAINKGIIAAIEGDNYLSKLLAAFDGAGNSLLLQSLIDGRYTMADIDIKFYDGAALLAFDYADLLQQAHDVREGSTTTNYGYRTYFLDLDKSTAVGDTSFNADAVGVTYTITIDGVDISYTQKLSDDDWTDIVTGLRAALAANTELNKAYDIQYIDALGFATPEVKNAVNDTADAYHPDQLAIVSTKQVIKGEHVDPEISYSVGAFDGTDATLTLSFPTKWGTTPVVGNEYVITFEDNAGNLHSITSGRVPDAASANWTWVREKWDADLTALATALGADKITISGTTTLKIVLEGVDVEASSGIQVDYSVRSTGDEVRTNHTSTVAYDTFNVGDTLSLVIDGVTVGTYLVSAVGGPLETWGQISNAMIYDLEHNDKLKDKYTLVTAADKMLTVTTDAPQVNPPSITASVDTTIGIASADDVDLDGEGTLVLSGLSLNGSDSLPTTVPDGQTITYSLTFTHSVLGGRTVTTTGFSNAPTLSEVLSALADASLGAVTITMGPDGNSFTIKENGADSPLGMTLTDTAITYEISGGGGTGTIFSYTGDLVAAYGHFEDNVRITTNAIGWSVYDYAPAATNSGNSAYLFTFDGNTVVVNLENLKAASGPDEKLQINEFVDYLKGLSAFSSKYSDIAAVGGALEFITKASYDLASIPPSLITVVAIDPAAIVNDGGDPSLQLSTRNIDLFAWANNFVSGAAGAGTIYTIEINGSVFSYTQHAGDTKWADIAEKLDEQVKAWNKNYTITALDNGSLRVTMPLNKGADDPVINGITYKHNPGIVTITYDNYTNISATGREIFVDAWDFTPYTKYPANYTPKTFSITIDLDGNAATTNDAVTLSYTERAHSDGTPDSWANIVANLNSLIKGTALDGVCEIEYKPGDVIGTLRVIFDDVDTDDISTYTSPTVTVNYVDDTNNSLTSDKINGKDSDNDSTNNNNILTPGWSGDTNQTENPALIGDDLHYYGYSEVYGGDGDDVLVTGYANAIVYGGAGNDVIVVGNETYNVVYGGEGEDSIWLGARSVVADNGTVLYQGNNGNNAGTALTNPDAHDKIFVGVGEGGDVIYNFDVGGTFTYATNITVAGDTIKETFTIQSDRLYMPGVGIDSVTFTVGANGDATVSCGGESVTLIGVGLVGNLVATVHTDATVGANYITIDLA